MSRPRERGENWLGQVGGIWYVYTRDTGAACGWRRRSTRTGDRAEAEKALAQAVLARSAPTRANADQYPIAACLVTYLQAIAEKPSIEQAAIAVEKHILPYWGEEMVAAITAARCEAWIAAMRCRGLRNGYISRILSVLRAAVRRAHRDSHVLQCPHIPDVKRPDPSDQRWLRPHEAVALIRACEPWPHLEMFVVVTLATGSRPGAVLALDVSQVDLSRRLIYLNPRGRVQTAKRRPIVPISDALYAYLQARMPPCGALVAYHGSDGVASVKRSLRTACAAAGLGKDVTAKTLRHTAASWALQAGAPEWKVAKMLGHADTRMVSRTYGHLTPSHLTDVAEAIAAGFHASFMQDGGLLADDAAAKSLKEMVGAVGFEPTTPTMSTLPPKAAIVEIQRHKRSRKAV